ncbi:HD domain-containing protein [uncultured Gimesia sp.]|uniref:3'-5' exoribonuclease YhaM family protein n=1 Tax=uncultured Gimesia sp. TaxID=1678688 RepID=UPI0030DACDDB|tara:strand:+ start:33321 stop:34340 length:1020 start_codon:yes stop_codon:yes gene_type:complete
MNSPQQVLLLSEMEPGQFADSFVLLISKEKSTTRDKKPYYRVQFRDHSVTATAMIWSDTTWFEDCESQWSEGEFYKVRARYDENKYGPQLDIDRIRAVVDDDTADGFDPSLYFKRSRFSSEDMFQELTEIATEQIEEVPLRNLVLDILEQYADQIKTIAAASKNHHAFTGGFLEHVLSVTRTAGYLADKYVAYYQKMQPPLNKSLVIAGAILHDIGKLTELEYKPHASSYTPAGRLIGHILLGRDLVREHARKFDDLDPETLLRLEHMIVSHQNLPEWGSPIAPHTPEALLVHYADDIDAKFHMMAATLENILPSNEDEFSSRDNALRRSIFLGLKSPE